MNIRARLEEIDASVIPSDTIWLPRLRIPIAIKSDSRRAHSIETMEPFNLFGEKTAELIRFELISATLSSHESHYAELKPPNRIGNIVFPLRNTLALLMFGQSSCCNPKFGRDEKSLFVLHAVQEV